MNNTKINKIVNGTTCSPELFKQLVESGGEESAIAYVEGLKGNNKPRVNNSPTVGFLNKFETIVRDEETGKDYRVTKMRFKLGIPREQVAGSPLEAQCEGDWLLLTGVFQPNKQSEGFYIGQDFIRSREQENLMEEEKSQKQGKKPYVIHDWMKSRTSNNIVEVQ